MDSLEPCIWCNNPNTTQDGKFSAWVYCKYCNSRGPEMVNKEDAIRKHNEIYSVLKRKKGETNG